MTITKSKKPTKKYDAYFVTNKNKLKIVSFGQRNADDFTITNDEAQRQRYMNRHKNDNLDDAMSPGALSWYILWSAKTLRQGIINYKSRFNL